MVLLGVVGNAAICGMLSMTLDRYQARVVWLVPLLAIVVGFWRAQRANDLRMIDARPPSDRHRPALPKT